MTLLLDQNLSPRLITVLGDLYPGSTHVRDAGLQAADDDTVWRYAAQHGFAIVSKDAAHLAHWNLLIFREGGAGAPDPLISRSATRTPDRP